MIYVIYNFIQYIPILGGTTYVTNIAFVSVEFDLFGYNHFTRMKRIRANIQQLTRVSGW